MNRSIYLSFQFVRLVNFSIFSSILSWDQQCSSNKTTKTEITLRVLFQSFFFLHRIVYHSGLKMASNILTNYASDEKRTPLMLCCRMDLEFCYYSVLRCGTLVFVELTFGSLLWKRSDTKTSVPRLENGHVERDNSLSLFLSLHMHVTNTET